MFQVRQATPDGHDERDHENIHQGSTEREANPQRTLYHVDGVVHRFAKC